MCRMPIAKYMEESMISGNFRSEPASRLNALDDSDPEKLFVFGRPVGTAYEGEVNGLEPVLEPEVGGFFFNT